VGIVAHANGIALLAIIRTVNGACILRVAAQTIAEGNSLSTNVSQNLGPMENGGQVVDALKGLAAPWTTLDDCKWVAQHVLHGYALFVIQTPSRCCRDTLFERTQRKLAPRGQEILVNAPQMAQDALL
jgi:hypothetical protein